MPLLVLTVICLVVSGALAMMNSITYPIISSAAAERAQVSMIETVPNAAGFEPVELSQIEELPASIREIYRTTNDVGYVFIASVNGFSGNIVVICGIDSDGNIIKSSTLSHTETKGIGTIIEQESFLGSFNGLDSRLEGIDTVAGATISTRAYIHAIEDIFIAFELVR
jgi:electron transport complex protein RnfG